MKLEERAQKADELLMKGKAREALQELQRALETENEEILDNPYLHLRKGQAHYILGEIEEASRELSIAYTLDGERIFEDEDPRFWEFLKEQGNTDDGMNEVNES